MAALAVSGVAVAVISVAAPMSAHAAGEVCVFTDGSQTASSASQAPFLVGVTVGDHVSISCTGLTPNASLAVAEANGGAGLVPGTASSNFTNIGNVILGATASATGTYSVTYTLNSFTAANGSACPPTQAQADAGISCSLAVAYAATFTNAASIELAFAAGPTPAAAQLNTDQSSYGAGATVTLSGSHLWGAPITGTPITGVPGTAPTLLLDGSPLANALTTTAATWPDPTASAFTSGGVLGGDLTVTLPSNIATGPHALTVVQANTTPYAGNGAQDTVTATAGFTVSGVTATASPAAGNVGTVVTVTGDNWVPGVAATLGFTSGPAADDGTATVNSSGHLSGTITVTGSETLGSNAIIVTQGSLSTSAAFQVVNIATLHENINQVVHGGTLSDSQANEPSTVTLSPITLDGTTQDGTGNLNDVTVTDARGSFGGWTLNGQLSGDFVNSGALTHNTIPAANLSWTPSIALASAGSGILSEVTAGPNGALSNTSAANLAKAAPGGGGGQFVAGAGLDLSIPPTIAAGTYTDTLDITLS